MPISSNFKTAYRGIFRRKIKNLSAVLAIFLGVTLLIGVQITSATLSQSFLTSLTLTQGEVDISFSSGTTGGYLNSTDYFLVENLTPSAVGIMPILLTSEPVLYKAQLQNSVDIAGIQLNYSRSFGTFYDLHGNAMNLTNVMPTNNSVIISKALAQNLGIDIKNFKPGLQVLTQFPKTELTGYLNMTSREPVLISNITQMKTYLTVTGIYDSRPGIGSQTISSAGRIIIQMKALQNIVKYTNPQMNPVNFFNTSNYQYITNPINKTDITPIIPLTFSYNDTNVISAYYVAFKTDHFTTGEWTKAQLQAKLDYAQKYNPKVVATYPNGTVVLNADKTPKVVSYFSITSARLQFYQIIDLISNLLNTFLNILGILIITTGLLLITNIQLMSVEDREFQTGVLRAVGDNKKGIIYKYLLETVAQGLVGGFLGLFGGLVFGWSIAYYLASLFDTGAGSVNPVVPPDLVILSLLIGVIIAVLTGIFPAIRASNVNIVEALRGIKTSFSEKSSRNFLILGIIITLIGLRVVLENGFFNTSYHYIWTTAGWDTIQEQQNIILGLGLLASGIGIILTKFIDRVKALNLTAFVLWLVPIYSYLVSLKWASLTGSGNTSEFLLITIIELIIGSVLIIGLDLGPIMDSIRNVLIKFNFSKGVAQVAPNLIKSHKTRSTLTFAIFAVILTLNVLIATMVATQTNSTVGKANSDSRGVGISVSLSQPEDPSYNYASLIKSLDPSTITDVIPFRTCSSCMPNNQPLLIATKNPNSKSFDPLKDLLPLQMVEVSKDQILGNITGSTQQILSQKWRYDFYLSASTGENGFPAGVREKYKPNMDDSQLNQLSKDGWLDLFNTTYKMNAYNLTSFLSGGFGSFGSTLSPNLLLRDANGTPIENPIVFTDSFILPVGSEIWIPMNGTGYATNYQRFTIGGSLDSQRAGGFPFSPQSFGNGFNNVHVEGDILMPTQWTKYTSYFGNATTPGVSPRNPHAYDKYLVKTSLSIDDPKMKVIASEIEAYTNTNNQGYRKLIGSNLIYATATTVYSVIKQNLQAANQIVSFLQIYVSFGLVIGALGMAIIAVRNVAERKREIGMMRAIGFPRGQVMFAVLLELFVLGIIGLIIGIVNGLLVGYGLSKLSGNTIIVPWDTITIYLGFITLVAVIAGVLPGWFAARIPASEALRYVG